MVKRQIVIGTGLLVGGALMLATPAVVVGYIGLPVRGLSTSIFVFQARAGFISDTRQAQIGSELARRHRASPLNEEHLGSLIKPALEVHERLGTRTSGGSGGPLEYASEAWLDLLGVAIEQDMLSEHELEVYMRWAVMDLRFPDTYRGLLGERIEIMPPDPDVLWMQGLARIADRGAFGVMLVPRRAEIDGQVIEVAGQVPGDDFFVNEEFAYPYLFEGSSPSWSFSYATIDSIGLPTSLPSGQHDLVIAGEAIGYLIGDPAAWGGGLLKSLHTARWPFEQRSTVTIVDRVEDAIHLRDGREGDPSHTPREVHCDTLEAVYRDWPMPSWYLWGFLRYEKYDAPGIDVVGTIMADFDGRLTPSLDSDGEHGTFDDRDEGFVAVPIPFTPIDDRAASVTLIIEPSLERAVRLPDVVELWNEPIVIEVPIDWSAMSEDKRPGPAEPMSQ